MKALILLNGEPFNGEIPAEDAYVICCDGAYSWAKGKVRIDENLGDFDSLDEVPDPAPRMKFPSEKNETDGELAVDRALDMGATEIVFYGGGGKREDHFLGNLHLLYKAHRAGAAACMMLEHAQMFMCGEGEHVFHCRKGQTVSVVPFGGDAHILHCRGLFYPMDSLALRYGSTRGISNLTVSDAFSVTVEKGHVLVILND